MCYTVVEAPQRYGRWCEAQFIVGQLETDSSKGAIMCRVWDCLQLRAVKTPDTSIKKDLLQEVFFYWLGKKFGGFFRRKNQNLGGVLRPPLGAECQIGVKIDLFLTLPRDFSREPRDEKSSLGGRKSSLGKIKKQKMLIFFIKRVTMYKK